MDCLRLIRKERPNAWIFLIAGMPEGKMLQASFFLLCHMDALGVGEIPHRRCFPYRDKSANALQKAPNRFDSCTDGHSPDEKRA